MFKSYLKVTLRKLYREKLYTLINIASFSLGIACCLILGLFLHSELTYDQHHKNHKRIYRVNMHVKMYGVDTTLALTSAALGSLLKKENPDVNDYVRFTKMRGNPQGTAYRSGDDTFFWKNVYLVDDNVFEVFTYDIIYGDPKTALVEPGSIAVSETFSRTYFGDENPIGKTVSTEFFGITKISLVFADLPDNTHHKPDVLISYNVPARQQDPSNLRDELWNRYSCYTYLVLPENYPQDSFKKMTEAFYQKNMKEIGDKNNWKMDFWLQPLKDIHYKSDVNVDEPTGNVLYLYVSVAVGLLVLLVACISYMNLATARSLKRGREVGIQRVIGANKSQLILQFMGESILITLMAFCVGLFIVKLLLIFPPINELIGNLQLTDYVTKPVLLCWLIGSMIFTGVVSGAYPAFYLSSIPPVAALTAIQKAATAQIKLRQILVLAQFIISIGVIAGTFLMISQMRYIANKPLGFAKENRVVMRLSGADVIEKHKVIKSELLKNPNVLGMTIGMPPGDFGELPFQANVENNNGSMVSLTIICLPVNDDYLQVMGIKLLEGWEFSKEISSDLNETVIVNETLVREMGWDNPLGKKIQWGNNTRRVIGVVKDFHFQSMHSPVAPFVLRRGDYDFSHLNADMRAIQTRMMIISISGEDMPQTIDHIKNVMGEIDPKYVLQYEFLEEINDRLYVADNQIMELTGLFACICVFISCLGLFGLSAFITEQRTREIGVCKVLGASSTQIIFRLFRPTLILVLIASVIASISAYLVIGEWLDSFAYRVEINPLIFVLATILAIIVAFLTITLQSLKTVQANPAEALRYE